MNTKIVVTGGAGFIGTNMLLALKQRYPEASLVSVDIREPLYAVEGVNYNICDVRDQTLLHSILEGSNKIFHLAAHIGTHESFDDPFKVFNINVNGTLNVLEFVRKNIDCEMYLAGMPGIWNNPYSISKDTAVRMAVSYYESYQIKVSVLRWFSVYGPYQYVSRYNKAVPTFITKSLANESLPVYGDGHQVADFIYVDDAVNLAIDSLENKNWGKVIQCASGQGISVNDLCNKIIGMCGSTSTIDYQPMRLGEPKGANVVADVTDLKKYYDRKILTIDEGLLKTINYYKENKVLD